MSINLIWDLDGTLIDSQSEVLEAMHFAAKDAELDESRMIKPFRSGPTIDNIFKECFPAEDLANGKLEKAAKAFRTHYDNSTFDRTVPFSGIEQIFDMDNVTNYIITNKPDYPTNRILKKLGWRDKFKNVITPYSFGSEKKKKPELFKILVESEKLDKVNTFGIGDMGTDIQAANSAGVNSIGVLWGTGTEKELKKAECTKLCGTTMQLYEFIKENCNI